MPLTTDIISIIQPNTKSVQATEVKPPGRTKNKLTTANTISSTANGIPDISEKRFPKATSCVHNQPNGTTIAITVTVLINILCSPYSFLKMSGMVENFCFFNQPANKTSITIPME